MRACLDGAEIPPWDVVESLFQDLATVRGAEFAQRESVRGAQLYAASVAACDRRPGGRQLLVERLEIMLREQASAAQRLSAAGADGATSPDEPAVAWARDDHERATARCAELRRRLAAVATRRDWFAAEGYAEAHSKAESGGGATSGPGPAPLPEFLPVPEPAPAHGPGPGPASVSEPVPEAVPEHGPGVPARESRPAVSRSRRPRGARFAGLEADDTAPTLPVAPDGAAVPRGARFGAAPPEDDAPRPGVPAAVDIEAQRAAAHAVGRLLRLRAEDRGGEAYVVLCEVAGWPADRLPVLAAELHRAGLDADWATLLWEISSLPPFELATIAGALAAAGRLEDCDRLLRQGVALPAAEIADAVVALDREGRGEQSRALLGAFVRVRAPQEAARVAECDPYRLLPQVMAAADAASPARERAIVHALRAAGLVGGARPGR